MLSTLFKKAFLFIMLLCSVSLLHAQEVQMADGIRSNGKIYVVVIVLSIILAGLFIFLLSIDRRISRLEKEKK